MTMPAHQSGSSAGRVIIPKRRGRELIRGRFVPRFDFDRRLNLEFHDRGPWRHNHGFRKIHRRPDLCVRPWAPASVIGVSLVNDKCSDHSSGLRLRLLALLEDVVLKYRQLGASELQVPVISLGSWLTYSGGVEKRQSLACVHKALDLGINFFDTANVYGRGAAESVLGEALAGIPRHSYSLATKVFFPMSDTDRGLSRAQIVKQLDASLKRLRTDYVDLYQCHRFDEETPLEETMMALTEAVRQGKTRYVGFSEWPLDKIEVAAKMPGVARFVSSQPQYSLLWPNPDNEIFPRCAELGIGQIVWSPLAQGVLTGKYKPGAPPPAGSRARHESMGAMLPKRWLRAPLLTAVQQVKLIAEREAGVSLAQFALAWVLRRQEVSSAIIGATRPEQVAEKAAAAEYQIAPELFARAEDILAPLRQGLLAWEVARRFRSTAEAFVRRIFGARGRT